MVNSSITLPLPIFISFVFSLSIFFYLFTFKEKNAPLKIYNHLFLTFVFSGFFLIFSDNILPTNFLLSSSFIIFLVFLIFTYRKYGDNQDLLYFILIIFYTLNITFYYLLIKHNSIFINFSSGNITYYLITLVLVFLLVIHKKTKTENNIIFFSYVLLLTFYLINIFYSALLNPWINVVLLISFFSLHLINSYQQAYSPLIRRIKKLKIQTNRQTAELPEHIRQQFQIMEHNKAKLMDMAYTDKMTGVFNKDKITSLIKDMIRDSRVNVFSIMMFDIDDFKKINDNLGHLVGDESLIDMAKLGMESIRKNDYIGRYGGDEFLIILSGLDPYETKVIAERFRTKIASRSKPNFTVSIGVASYPEDGKTFKELIEAADKALYLSKKRGKNRVSHLKLY